MSNQSNVAENAKKDPVIWVGIAVVVGVIVVWVISWMLIDKYVLSSNLALGTNEAARGVFGDKFGAVNALFSGLAFTGIIWTLILQRRDLSLQRAEIKDQNDSLKRQNFENTLFHLISLHTSILEKLKIRSEHGRDAFREFIAILKACSDELRIFHIIQSLEEIDRNKIITTNEVPEELLSKLDKSDQEVLKKDISLNFVKFKKYDSSDLSFHESLINSAYEKAHKTSGDALSHYFRNLYHIFKFIEEYEIEEKWKNKYAAIVRAQLSDDELVVIFYNCVARLDASKTVLELGYPKMTALVGKFDIIQNINNHSIFHKTHFQIFEERKTSANLKVNL